MIEFDEGFGSAGYRWSGVRQGGPGRRRWSTQGSGRAYDGRRGLQDDVGCTQGRNGGVDQRIQYGDAERGRADADSEGMQGRDEPPNNRPCTRALHLRVKRDFCKLVERVGRRHTQGGPYAGEQQRTWL